MNRTKGLPLAWSAVLLALALLFRAPGPASAQEPDPDSVKPPPSVIDTVILERHDVFSPDVAAKGFFYRVMNSLHVITKPHVIVDELLFLPGEPFDSAAVAESERNLRNRFIFSELDIDTLRLDDGRLGVQVYTRDAFSTKPRLSFSVASDGRLIGQFGVTEVNLVGTGSMVMRQSANCPLPPLCFLCRPWACIFLRMVSR